MKNNLQVVTQKTNRGRPDKPFSLWEGPDGIMLSPEVSAAMAARERTLAIEIQDMINTLLAQQQKVPGTVRPATGTSGVGLRLTSEAARGLQPDRASEEQSSSWPISKGRSPWRGVRCSSSQKKGCT